MLGKVTLKIPKRKRMSSVAKGKMALNTYCTNTVAPRLMWIA